MGKRNAEQDVTFRSTYTGHTDTFEAVKHVKLDSVNEEHNVNFDTSLLKPGITSTGIPGMTRTTSILTKERRAITSDWIPGMRSRTSILITARTSKASNWIPEMRTATSILRTERTYPQHP